MLGMGSLAAVETTSPPRTRWTAPPALVPLWSAAAAFGAYFCMYGFRKPFTASTYDAVAIGALDYKTLLVVAQVLGYTLSKFVGIRVIAEMPGSRRAAAFLTLIAGAQSALLVFAVVPPPWGAALLFVNGLFLGMVFGLVLGFLEGRQVTEVLTAVLCASFILGDGFTKSVGAALLAAGVTEAWMPSVAGIAFVLPLVSFIWMLGRIPPPSAEDVLRRQERVPMNRTARREFFRRYAAGLVPLVVMYLLVTILRSLRADFAPEIWQGLGAAADASRYTTSELVVAASVIFITALSFLIRNNRAAFFAALAASLVGVALVGAATLALRYQAIDGFTFMVLVGSGLYLPYVAVHTTLFERLIAMTRERGNIGFLMYVADACGYLGYAAVACGKLFFHADGSMLDFFATASLIASTASIVLLAAAWRYFGIAKR